MQTGKLYLYKKYKNSKPKLVLITSGRYGINGRVCNFWNFTEINPDGTLSNIVKGGDYDNAEYKFEEVDDSMYEIEFNLNINLTDKIFPNSGLGKYI